MKRNHSLIRTVIAAILLTAVLCTPALAATYSGSDVYQGRNGIQPEDTLVLPGDTIRANLTASWGVRVIFQDYDGTELQNELKPVTDEVPGSTDTPSDPSRSGWTFKGWKRIDSNGDENVYIDGTRVCQITGPGPIIYQAEYEKIPEEATPSDATPSDKDRTPEDGKKPDGGKTPTGGSSGTGSTRYGSTGEVKSEEFLPVSVMAGDGAVLPQTGTTFVLAGILAIVGIILLLIGSMIGRKKKGLKRIVTLMLAAVMFAATVLPCTFSSYAAEEPVAAYEGAHTATPSEAVTAEPEEALIETEEAASAAEAEAYEGPSAATPSEAGSEAASSESFEELPEASPSEAKKVYTAVVDGVTVTVTADEGVFPDNAELSVDKVESELEEELDAVVSRERKAGTKTSASYAFDIKMLADGEEVQPDNTKGNVYVSFAMDKTLNAVDKADIYHIREEENEEVTVLKAEKLDILPAEEAEKITGAAENAEAVTDDALLSDGELENDLYGEDEACTEAEPSENEANDEAGELMLTAQTDGFSFYVVQFIYDSFTYEIGNRDDAVDDENVNTAYLSGILQKFGFTDADIQGVTEAETDDTEDALCLEKGDSNPGYWYIQVKERFEGRKTLTVTAGGTTYTINITCGTGWEYEMEYRPGTADSVTIPANDTGIGGAAYQVSELRPVRSGYEFIDWTLFWEEYYTVYYLENETGYQLAEPKVVTGVESGESVTESAKEIDGYTLVSDTDQSITISEGDSNIIIFYYKAGPSSYTVQYLEEGTNKQLADTKIGPDTSVGETVTEDAITIENYDLVSDGSLTIVIDRDTDKNIIIFYYKQAIGAYEVQYLEEGTEKQLAEPKVEQEQPVGSEVTEGAIVIENYDLVSETPQTITIDRDNDQNIIKFYYKKAAADYEVLYLEEGTEKQLAEPKAVKGQTVGEEVSEDAIDIENYDLVSATPQTITLGRDNSKNIIIFYYKKALTDYEVQYLEEGTEKQLAEPKAVKDQTVGKEVSEDAIDIENYDLVSATPQTITLVRDAEQNVIKFYYKKAVADCEVLYLEEGTEKQLADSVKEKGKEVGSTFEAEAEDIENYDLVSEEKQSLTVDRDSGKNVLKFYYKRALTAYEVRYLEKDTEKQLADLKTVTGQAVGDKVSEDAIDIENYDLVSETPQTITLERDADQNIIKFYYKKALTGYTVRYIDRETGEDILESKSVEEQKVGTNVTETAPATIADYDLDDEAQKNMTLQKDAYSNEIIFYYRPALTEYIVRCVDETTNEPIIPDQTFIDQVVGARPTVNAPNLTEMGYNITSQSRLRRYLDRDVNNNIFVFKYMPNG